MNNPGFMGLSDNHGVLSDYKGRNWSSLTNEEKWHASLMILGWCQVPMQNYSGHWIWHSPCGRGVEELIPPNPYRQDGPALQLFDTKVIEYRMLLGKNYQSGKFCCDFMGKGGACGVVLADSSREAICEACFYGWQGTQGDDE